MNLLGNKVQARAVARKLGIPVVPGSDGAVDIATARQLISEIGLPIMLKAEGGGGGRGIFAIHNEAELEDAFFKASTMAQASFGNPRLFVEKFLADVRHIEIQVIADMYGNVFAFDERDCTVQRNHQKLVEITPSPWPGMTRQLREQLKDYARRLVRAVGYHSLATVEFLVTPDGTPYMIEVNTRLQVEHGITECRYGIDLVEEQIAVAFGAELRYREENLRPSYCAMQVRINCENPQENFAPNAGLITRYVSPGGPGVRLDSNISAGYEFPANYDSAGSLLIAYAHDWEKTLGIMDRALSEYIIGGIKTTIPFHRQILKHQLRGQPSRAHAVPGRGPRKRTSGPPGGGDLRQGLQPPCAARGIPFRHHAPSGRLRSGAAAHPQPAAPPAVSLSSGRPPRPAGLHPRQRLRALYGYHAA